jgi:dihydrofolate synthase/folylpolyglutamate synthase
VLELRAEQVGAPLFRWGREWQAAPRGDGFRYEGSRVLDLPPPALPGEHQVLNAATAIAALDRAVPGLPEAAIRQGLAAIEWPARLQRLVAGPLVGLLPPGTTLTLDGGHNEHAAIALAAWIAAGPLPVDLVLGMRATKAHEAFLTRLAPVARALRAVAIEGDPGSLTAERLAGTARAAGIADAAPSGSLADAVRSLARRADPAARILVCGSLYLAGKVLEENG